MLKRFYSLTLVLFASIMMAWADSEATYYPIQEVCFRTGNGNTAWNSGYPKDAADDGNTQFEGNYQAGLFTLQKYKVDNLSDVTSIVLTLTAGSGVDATRVWLFPTNDWSTSSSIDDMVNYVTEVVGFAPRSTEGTANAYLADGVKVAGSDPIKATLTISGTALATLKAGAAADGTFTLMITDKSLITSSSRKFLTSNTANAEANRPTLVAKIEIPAVTNQETSVGYATLADAISDAGATATLLINKDVEITARQEITGKAITFKGNGFRDLYAVDLQIASGKTIHSVDVGHESDAKTSVTFDFTGADLGKYDAVFHFTEEDKPFANVVTVEEAVDIELATNVSFPSTFLRGTSTTFTIKITNKGNMTAYAVPIEIQLLTQRLDAISEIKLSETPLH